MATKNIEGFLMIKRQDASIFKRWQNKYVVLDNQHSHTLSIFPDKPIDEFEVGSEIDVKQDNDQVLVEQVIDLLDVEQVNYIRNKNKGMTFELHFNQQRLEDSQKKLVKYTMAADSQKTARKWAKRLISGVFLQRSSKLSVKRKSLKAAGLSGSQKSSISIASFSPERKSNAEKQSSDPPLIKPRKSDAERPLNDPPLIKARKSDAERPVNDSPLFKGRKSDVGDRKASVHTKSPADGNVRSMSLILNDASFVAIPISKIPQKSEEDLWKTMMKPISPSSLSPRNSDLSRKSSSNRPSRREIIFSKDSDALLQLIESASNSSAGSTPRRSRRGTPTSINFKSKKVQVAVSPFKNAIWDVIMLYYRRHKLYIPEADTNLRERTIQVIQKLCNDQKIGKYSFLKLTENTGLFFEDMNKSVQEFNDTELIALANALSLGTSKEEENVCYEDFEVVFMLPNSNLPFDEKVPEQENLYFWIHEMRKPENHKGITRHLKNCVTIYNGDEIVGMKIGKPWNPTYPVFRGSDMIAWLSSKVQLGSSSSDVKALAQMAIDKKFIGEILSENYTILPVNLFSSEAFYFFWEEVVHDDQKTLKKSIERLHSSFYDSKEPFPKDDDLSFSISQVDKTESDDDLFPTYEITEIIASPEFLDFFCCFASDSTLLSCILQQMYCKTRFNLRDLLAEWKALTLLRDRNVCTDEQNWLKMKIFAQSLYEFVIEYSPLLKTKLLDVFKINNSESHALAIDLYWELLKMESIDRHLCNSSLTCSICMSIDSSFNSFVQEILNAPEFSTDPVMRSLMGTLIDDVWFPIKPIAFNNQVVRPGLWKSFFCVLKNCEINLKTEFLRDAYSLFIDKEANAFSLIAQRGWISWILCMIPSVQGNEEANVLLNNLMSRVLFHSFFNNKDFPIRFTNSMIEIEESASQIGSINALLSGYNILQALIGSIASNMNKFQFFSNSSELHECFFNVKFIAQIAINFLFFRKSFAKDASLKRKMIIDMDGVKTYLDHRIDLGIHMEYRRYSKRILKALQDSLAGVIRILDTVSQDISSSLLKSLKMQLNELQDFDALLQLFSSAEERIHRFKVMSITAMDRYSHGLSISFMEELIRKFCAAYPEKRSGLVAFIFPEQINEEIRRMYPNIK